MNYILSEHPQGTVAWKLARAGKATGSRAGDILSKVKIGEAAARKNYRIQLVTERLSGAPAEDGYVNEAMQWGTQQEPFARMAYEELTGAVVREAGFAYLPDIEAGASVDGFIDDHGRVGILECKCPNTATHVGYLLANRIPPAYEPQLNHNLWITGAEFADFVSFDPRLPEQLQLFHFRMYRDDKTIREHEAAVYLFLQEVDTTVERLRTRVLLRGGMSETELLATQG